MRRSMMVMMVVAIAVCVTTARGQDEVSPIGEALRKADTAVQRIVEIPDRQRTFRNTVEAIDDLLARLEMDTNMTQFMAHVSTDREARARGQQAEKDFTNWLIELGKNENLYRGVRAFADSGAELDAVEQRLLDHTLRDYRRAGMALPPERREELKAVQKQITELSVEFDTNINEDRTRVPLSRDELEGLPEDWFEQFGPELSDQDVYLVGLSYPEFIPVMTYVEDATTRHKLWLAYKRRGGQRNVEILEELLRLRAEAAAILGYAHAADFEIEVRMAKQAANVVDFYRKLRPLVRTKAERDYAELLASKRKDVGRSADVVHPWDTSFYTNRILKEKYAVDSEKVREYFPLDRVTKGLFDITQSLYGLTYKDVTAAARARGRALWHEDVQLFEVWDNERGEMLGEFFIDLHPRDNKYGHAAQWGLRQHKINADGTVTKPLAALVCNFPKPTSERPSLLSHDQVETYFHEFGHCLHTILSEARFWQQAGTNVERDFVEAPSQMFENWVWNVEVLNTFAAHYERGEPLPENVLESMIAARFLGSGMLAERQFFYGLFDLKCHLTPTGMVDTNQLGYDLWSSGGENVELYEPVPATFFQAAFGHLTGYQAGYYGYQWSLVYACDMFQRFDEMGMLNPEAGRYYRKKILARGGTMDGLDMVRDYLGREPDMKSFLRHLGLSDE